MGDVATADVIYSNLAVDGTYHCCNAKIVRGCCTSPSPWSAWSVGFVATRDARLDTVELALSAINDTDIVEVQLLESDAGSPGNLIESLGIVSDLPPIFSTDSILTEVSSASRPLLVTGTEYFIAVLPADPETEAGWSSTSTEATGAFASTDEGPWSFRDTAQPALRLSGTQCGTGSVNAGNGWVTNVLFINGLMGGADRTVEATDEELISVTVLNPIAGGNGKFVLHANLGNASSGTLTDLPFEIGSVCFPLLLSGGAAPVIIANNLGKSNQVGESHFLGSPTVDPERATTTFLYPNFPVGMELTFQGVIVDPAAPSEKGVSATNAVTLEIVP